MRILGLTGKKYAGKDTAALALVEEGWVRIAFADALRDMLYVLNPIVEAAHPPVTLRWQEVWDEDGYDYLKTLPEARRLMQVFGTEVIRDMVGPDTWVAIAKRKIIAVDVARDMPGVVVTDVRFDNEAKMIRDLGGDVVRIVYTGPHTRDEHGADHVSEVGVTDALVDYTVYNAGTIDDLHRHIRRVARGVPV